MNSINEVDQSQEDKSGYENQQQTPLNEYPSKIYFEPMGEGLNESRYKDDRSYYLN